MTKLLALPSLASTICMISMSTAVPSVLNASSETHSILLTMWIHEFMKSDVFLVRCA